MAEDSSAVAAADWSPEDRLIAQLLRTWVAEQTTPARKVLVVYVNGILNDTNASAPAGLHELVRALGTRSVVWYTNDFLSTDFCRQLLWNAAQTLTSPAVAATVTTLAVAGLAYDQWNAWNGKDAVVLPAVRALLSQTSELPWARIAKNVAQTKADEEWRPTQPRALELVSWVKRWIDSGEYAVLVVGHSFGAMCVERAKVVSQLDERHRPHARVLLLGSPEHAASFHDMSTFSVRHDEDIVRYLQAGTGDARISMSNVDAHYLKSYVNLFA